MPLKSLAIVAITEELLRQTNINFFQSELQRAVAVAVHTAFISRITNGISPTTSSGTNARAVLQDFYAGLAALNLDAGSKVFVATSPAIVKAWAFRTTSTGQRAFRKLPAARAMRRRLQKACDDTAAL